MKAGKVYIELGELKFLFQKKRKVKKVIFPWQEKLVAPLIATSNEDTQFEDEVTKREKGKGLRYSLHIKSFVCNKMDKVLVRITIMQEVSLKRVE